MKSSAARSIVRGLARFEPKFQVGRDSAVRLPRVPCSASRRAPRMRKAPAFQFSIFQVSGLTILLCAALFLTDARAQWSPPQANTTRSVSGQFIVVGAPTSRLAGLPAIVADTNLVRLEPALLSVSAERIKESLRHELDISADAPWRGQIFLVLHPAQSPDEDVTIVSQSYADGWDYRVQLPDVLSRTRFLRAMTGVLLLEMANRNAYAARSAEIPSWLTDGLAEEPSAAGSPELILSAPGKLVSGLPQSRTVATERGLHPLADARRVLRDGGTLTFEQLSWPTEFQSAGDDGGVYRANAQVFVSELLNLKNGPACLRAMLAELPGCYNWQKAFQTAFRAYFPQPLDVEKWWALQVVSFVAHDPGPRWTTAVSRERLDEILSVPVEVWTASNTLPARADISLQAVVRNFQPPRRTEILQVKLRDLELAQLRLAAPMAGLGDGYRRVLADFLGQHEKPAVALALGKHPPAAPKAGDVRGTLKKLDLLDARRRAVEADVKPEILLP